MSDYTSEAPGAIEAADIPKHCIKDTEGWKLVDELLRAAVLW